MRSDVTSRHDQTPFALRHRHHQPLLGQIQRHVHDPFGLHQLIRQLRDPPPVPPVLFVVGMADHLHPVRLAPGEISGPVQNVAPALLLGLQKQLPPGVLAGQSGLRVAFVIPDSGALLLMRAPDGHGPGGHGRGQQVHSFILFLFRHLGLFQPTTCF